jgi:hypothetical protein
VAVSVRCLYDERHGRFSTRPYRAGALAWVLGIGAPAIAAVVWGTFIAPKATSPLSTPFRVSLELDLFVVSAVAMWFAGAPVAAVALAVLGVSTSLLNVVTEGA